MRGVLCISLRFILDKRISLTTVLNAFVKKNHLIIITKIDIKALLSVPSRRAVTVERKEQKPD